MSEAAEVQRLDPQDESDTLNRVFAALSDPVRRQILTRLEKEECLVSELAAPFDISLQAVSRHIQVLVRAGLVTQERSGRISRCRLDAGPILTAAVWLNQYSKYWQAQFDALAVWLGELDAKPTRKKNAFLMLQARDAAPGALEIIAHVEFQPPQSRTFQLDHVPVHVGVESTVIGARGQYVSRVQAVDGADEFDAAEDMVRHIIRIKILKQFPIVP